MNIARIIIRTLLIGLLLHFVVLTWLEYTMGISGIGLTIVALWKEIVVMIWGGWLACFHYQSIVAVRNRDRIFRVMLSIFCLTIAVTLLISAWGGYSLFSYISAARYNFVGYAIGLLGYVTGTMMDWSDGKKLTKWYVGVIKVMLILSVIWYAALVIKPGVLKYLGYSKYVYEGTLDGQPPAVYYSEMTSGIQRNQFFFERPITYGFWLTAFWPLFYVVAIRRQKVSETWFWWLMYTMAIICTFSRAAWGVWIVQLALLGYRTYKKTFDQFARKILLPALALIGIVSYFGYHQIFGGGRQFSNTGHINALITSIHAIADRGLLGRGPGSVGPASHHFGLGYNTENQFLQVWIEYGIIGFIGWLVLFMSVIVGGIWLFYGGQKHKQSDYLIAYAIGMIGLALSGLVLHPWVDRMVVWPMMIMIGISWGIYSSSKIHS